ncbi:MAG: GntR family transcriptional regulator [Clostridiales bacterium]|mgnify:CR=1 FL=1|jgi:K+/H+ antiporter YhaU regulatory subunit KhtT|nr:GntR family transcriptional regulator [Clostridiales bacterium]
MPDTVNKNIPPQYSQIAVDIARRIVEGNIAEGSKLYGRSVMSSEYGVSPETIRRAFRLLADMKVIEVMPQSGAYVLSADSAKRFLDRTDELENGRNLQSRLNGLLQEQARLAKELQQITAAMVKRQETLFSAAEQGFGVGEVRIGKGAWVIGKTIGQLAFWQATGATIIAIRRGQSLIVSPGPYAVLYQDDCIVFVANEMAMDTISDFVNNPMDSERKENIGG